MYIYFILYQYIIIILLSPCSIILFVHDFLHWSKRDANMLSIVIGGELVETGESDLSEN
jgi:hypothetical protein